VVGSIKKLENAVLLNSRKAGRKKVSFLIHFHSIDEKSPKKVSRLLAIIWLLAGCPTFMEHLAKTLPSSLNQGLKIFRVAT